MNLFNSIAEYFGALNPETQGIIVTGCTLYSLILILRSGPNQYGN